MDRQSTVILLLFYTIRRRVSYVCSQVRFIYKKKWPYRGSNTSHLIVYLSKPFGPVTCGYHPRSHNNNNNTRYTCMYIYIHHLHTTYVFTMYIYCVSTGTVREGIARDLRSSLLIYI